MKRLGNTSFRVWRRTREEGDFTAVKDEVKYYFQLQRYCAVHVEREEIT